MKNMLLVLGAVVLVIGGAIFLGSNDPQNIANSELTTNQLNEIQTALNNGAVLVDVRTPQEFAESHAVGAINVPLQGIQQGDYGNLPQDETLYIYCRSGNRSAQAISLLNQNGYNDTVDLVSLTQWQSLGGDVTSG